LTVNLVIQRPTTTTQTPDDVQIKHWLHVFSMATSASGEVTIRIVDPDEITDLNRLYRNRNEPTNVLSFPFVDPPGVQSNILGDMLICADVVNDEARQQQIPVPHHWAHMLAHSLLHLLGHDHLQEEEAQAMEDLERALLARIDIPDPYITEKT